MMTTTDLSIRISDLEEAVARLERQVATAPDCETARDSLTVYRRKLEQAREAYRHAEYREFCDYLENERD